MGTQFWVVQAFNGVSYGALLFLVGSGLSLIFGVMRIVNLAHGSYFLLGGYIALSVIRCDRVVGAVAAGRRARGRAYRPGDGAAVPAIGRFRICPQRGYRTRPRQSWPPWPRPEATLSAPAGARSSRSPRSSPQPYFVLNRVAIVPIETDVLRQVLLTVGFAFLFQQGALDIWGGNNMDINPPTALTQKHRRSAASIFRSTACS